MNDTDLDELIAALARVSDADVARWDLTGPEHEMCEAIMSAKATLTDVTVEGAVRSRGDGRLRDDEPGADEISLTRAGSGQRRRRPLFTALAAATAVALVVLGVWVAGGPRSSRYSVAPAQVAESAPRLLVDLPGWRITRVEEFSADQGEMTFSDGVSTLDLTWQDADEHRNLMIDRRESMTGEPITILGRPAETFVYRQPGPPPVGTPDDHTLTPEQEAFGDFTALWRHGAGGVEARGRFATVAGYTAALAGLVEVDVDTWLEAMPATVVRPDSHAAAVDAMLEDIPLPPGFDVGSLREDESGVRDRYQLGAEVTRAVACGWIESWLEARDAGDTEAAQRAVAAMSTSRDWAILLEMEDQGGWSQEVWMYADAMPTDAPLQMGEELTIADSYRQSLGCGP